MPRAHFPSGRKSLVLLVLAVLIAVAWWWQRPPPEPMHDGQPLSQWLEDSVNRGNNRTLSPEKFRGLGPEVVPWLIYQVEHGQRPFVRRGLFPFDKAPDWLRRRIPAKWGGPLAPEALLIQDERLAPAVALQALGPEAAPAIPALAAALEKVSDDQEKTFTYCVAWALQATGPKSWPRVQRLLARGSVGVKSDLITSLAARLGPVEHPATDSEVRNALEAMLKASHDPDAFLRKSAAFAIAYSCNRRPDLGALDSVVPELVRLLSDSDAEVRKAAADELAQCGARATLTIPSLIALLDDSNAKVKAGAIYSLGHLDKSEKLSATRLRALFHGPDAGCRMAAADALEQLGLLSHEENLRSRGEGLPGLQSGP